MKVAKKYSKDYWDGDRKFGYGGYFYKKGYWKKTALKIIKTYNLEKFVYLRYRLRKRVLII